MNDLEFSVIEQKVVEQLRSGNEVLKRMNQVIKSLFDCLNLWTIILILIVIVAKIFLLCVPFHIIKSNKFGKNSFHACRDV